MLKTEKDEPSRRDFSWPLRDDEVNEIEQADAAGHDAVADRARADDGELLERVGRRKRLKPIVSPDPRSYRSRLRKARRTRRRRISRIGMTVAAVAAALVVTALLGIRMRTARADAPDAAVTKPLPSASLSERLGPDRLIRAPEPRSVHVQP